MARVKWWLSWLGTVYALSATDEDAVSQGLSTLISSGDLGLLAGKQGCLFAGVVCL